jgi:hypothetical protein
MKGGLAPGGFNFDAKLWVFQQHSYIVLNDGLEICSQW